MSSIVYKAVSCLSILLALFLIYDLIKELNSGMSVFDINLLPFLTALIVVSNGVLAFLLLIGKIRHQKILLIIQMLVIIPMCWELYEMLFRSTISCA